MPVCRYVGSMNWQNILVLVIVLGVATFFVWRSSGTKKHNHGCNCGCAQEDDAGPQKDQAGL
jgi:F0F1-type ATP synthase assembly protein I